MMFSRGSWGAGGACGAAAAGVDLARTRDTGLQPLDVDLAEPKVARAGNSGLEEIARDLVDRDAARAGDLRAGKRRNGDGQLDRMVVRPAEVEP